VPRYARRVPGRSDSFDLAALRLSAGEGRRLELQVEIDPFLLSGERYRVEPALIRLRLDISRTGGDGYVLRLRFQAALAGPCMRCLESAQIASTVDAREVSQPKAIDELDEPHDLESPYVQRGTLDLRAWARDSLALVLPAALLCRSDCAGLCSVCGADLNYVGAEHTHEGRPPDELGTAQRDGSREGRLDDSGERGQTRARDPAAPWAKLSEIRFE